MNQFRKPIQKIHQIGLKRQLCLEDGERATTIIFAISERAITKERSREKRSLK